MNDIAISARMLATPHIMSRDVWVERQTDNRWIVHRVTNAVEIRGYPLVVNVELRLAPRSHIVYQFEIDGQVPV